MVFIEKINWMPKECTSVEQEMIERQNKADIFRHITEEIPGYKDSNQLQVIHLQQTQK